MFRLAYSGIVPVLLLSLADARPAHAADGDKDVQAIVAKAIEAKGGAANLDKFQASVSKFKGTLTVGGMDVNMTGVTKDQIPDKLRLDATMKVGGQDVTLVQIINGKQGWQGLNGQFADIDKNTLAESREQFHAGQVSELRGLKAAGVKLSVLGDSKIDGKAAVGVKVSLKGYRDVNLYFDKTDSQLLKSETKGNDPMVGGEFKSETFYSNYKKVDGVNVPHKVKVLRDGNPFMQLEMSSVTLHEKLDDKDFAKPADEK